MTEFCYEFISGYGSAIIIKNWLRFAKLLTKFNVTFLTDHRVLIFKQNKNEFNFIIRPWKSYQNKLMKL